MYYLLHPDFLVFPPAHLADAEGLVAIGGELTTAQLLLAYRSGLFPWYGIGEPVCWYSPDPRCVIFPETLYISKSMRKILRDGEFQITVNSAFEEVIKKCASAPRKKQSGLGWLSDEMQEAYKRLYLKGHAISIEAWKNGELVGGLYGVLLGKIFCGESMFSLLPNASKAAFLSYAQHFFEKGGKLIDCQQDTPHLRSLGAVTIRRSEFLELLSRYTSS